MRRLVNFHIGTKIYSVVGLLSIVSICIAGLALSAMATYNQQVAEMQNASQRAFIGEQINTMIYAVVMDSRGVYMARDRAEAEKFGNPLIKNLRVIEKLMQTWQELLPEARKHETGKAWDNVKKFVEYRSETVRLGVESGSSAAREFGDNDANRANRQSLNKEIQTLAESTNAEITQLKNALDGYYSTKMIELVALTAIGVLASFGLSMMTVIGFITRPIAALTQVMKQLAGGSSDVIVPGADRGDELGDMSRAVLVFQEGMAKTQELEEAKRAEEAAAESRRVGLEKLINDFGVDVDGVVQAVASSASEMRGTAESLSATAEETAQQTTAVAAAAEEASSNVQTVASAAEELHASIAEIGRQVARSAEIADKAVSETAHTDTNVAALAAAAQKIGEVVQLIQDIASQTNLLALNATIEAARAGEAGKGFAVVASEVKSLATQTAKATEEIAGQINAIQSATGSVVSAIRGIGTTITEMSEIATAIASAIEEQGAATREIAGNVQQAAAGTNEVSSNIATVTAATSENGAAASQVLETATALAQQADTLRQRVDQFVGAVRVA